jgi:hypothetical protein
MLACKRMSERRVKAGYSYPLLGVEIVLSI